MGKIIKNAPILFIRLAVLAGLFMLATRTYGQDVKMSQYIHTVWRSGDAFDGSPTALEQAKDGYLWMGTKTDLLRFDGVRFSRWSQQASNLQIGDAGVTALTATADGSLWIAGRNLMRLKDGSVTSYKKQVTGLTLAIAEDPAGGIWAARILASDHSGPLCRVLDLQVKCFGKDDGMPIRDASALFRDEHGTLWLGGTHAIVNGSPGAWKQFPLLPSKSLSSETTVSAFERGGDGSILVARDNWRLEGYLNGSWIPFKLHGTDGFAGGVNVIRRLKDNTLWIGTKRDGIYVVRGERVEHFSPSDGLSGEDVIAICEDHEANVWIATTEGLDRFRIPKIISFSRREGLSDHDAGPVLASHDGGIYVGNQDALDVLRGGSISSIRASQGLPGPNISAMLEDHAGRLWMGTGRIITVKEGSHFRVISRDLPADINAMREDGSGDIWFICGGYEPKLFCIHDYSIGEVNITATAASIYSIGVDSKGALLANYEDGSIFSYRNGIVSRLKSEGKIQLYLMGLLVDGHIVGTTSSNIVFGGYQDGTFRTLGLANGLPCENVYSFLGDEQGALWLYAQCGLIEISKTDLDKWWKDPKAKLVPHLFDSADGARPAWSDTRPPAALGPDGKLWFVNDDFLQMFDTKNTRTNILPPPVHIESLTADGNSYSIQQAPRLPQLTRNLEIDYTALSLTIPQKVQFRYRLEGRDKDWEDAGNRRQVFYTDLPPATYHFHVIAANSDGVWNTIGDTLTFVVPSAFYQTAWFKALLGVAAACLLWIFYVLRLRNATAEVRTRLGERLQERERIARELHDTLLQDFQAVILRFQLATNRLVQGDPNRRRLEEDLDYADTILAQGRDHIRGIRADTNELPEALASYGEELSQLWPLEFAIATTGPQVELRPIVREEIYRIGREAILNAFKHSNGTTVQVKIDYKKNEFRMTVCDDGDGISPSLLRDGRPGHWGLNNMRERARKIGASLDFRSQSGVGTCLNLATSTQPAKIKRYFRLPWNRADNSVSNSNRRSN